MDLLPALCMASIEFGLGVQCESNYADRVLLKRMKIQSHYACNVIVMQVTSHLTSEQHQTTNNRNM